MNRDTKIGGLRQAADAGNRIFSFHSVFQARLLAVVAAALIAASPAHGNPKGGQVSVGSAAISQTSFSIAPNEQTNFQQPTATSVTLNRVPPGEPSVIAGRLTANGQIVLINPSGIAFSKGAVVDVNSLVATPTDISMRTSWPGA